MYNKTAYNYRNENTMDSRDILQKIVDEEGNCLWALNFKPTDPYYICRLCPMSKLKKDKNGRYLSCFEALGCHELQRVWERSKRYVEEAKKMLSDLSIEDMLTEEE